MPERMGQGTQLETVWGTLTFEPVGPAHGAPRAGSGADAEPGAGDGATTRSAAPGRAGAASRSAASRASDPARDELRRRAEEHAAARAVTASGRPRADRAAQFMPFAALRGYYELIHRQERVPEPRHELTEEEALALSRTVTLVRRGDIVRAVYYDQDAYVAITGCVARIDLAYRALMVVQTTIDLDDLRELEILE